MGKKISVDSSTLMNKILELAEAQKLFNISNDKLDILVHPDSLVHAIIEFKNGLVKFMYHDTSMIIPLANAIFDGKIDIKNFYQNRDLKFKDKVTNFLERNISKKYNIFFFDPPYADKDFINNLDLIKYVKQNIYGDKIVIGMGAGSISNWIRELPKNIK